MAKMSKWLGLALAAVVMTVGGLVLGTGAAEAQAPQSPARFVGTVKVDGAYVPAGTLIEAYVNGSLCGVATTFNSDGAARYSLDVKAAQPEPPDQVNCGTVGDQVTFYIGGKMAMETGSWNNAILNVLNLTYVTPTPTATATTVPSATATATTAATPKPPSTGQGQSGSESGAMTLVVALLALGAVAFGMGGVAAAKRSR